jgi:formate hydrogenlyase subunit 6/NADH:ubiquinone oxidoreductase subunit I
MKKPKLRELGEALKVLFIEGPYTSKFPKEPHVPPETFKGKPQYDEKKCIGCGACAQVCPSRAIEIIDDTETGKRKLALRYDICIFCGQCHAYCTTKEGITLSNEYDLATLDRSGTLESVEKDIVMCEMCGSVVAALDHLCWISNKLGTLAYANPSLVLASLSGLSLVETGAARGKEVSPARSDLLRILCPKCRRDIYLREEWK